MRRHEKEITDIVELEAIIRRCTVCRLGMVDGDKPYIVPLNFGYHDKQVYFHCATEGRKLELLRRNNHVCVQFDTDVQIIPADQASGWTTLYASLIGEGIAEIIDSPEEMKEAYNHLMRQYTETVYTFPDPCIKRSLIIKVTLTSLTGKKSA